MDSDNTLVSIGLTTFKRAVYLEKAISSLQNQTYRNIEIIISQDLYHTDEIENLVKTHQACDERIKFFRQKHQLFMNGNFIFTLSVAKGEYFFWASDDDLWDPMFIEKLVVALKNDNALTHVCCRTMLIGPNNEELGILNHDFNYVHEDAFNRYAKFLDNLLLTNYPFYGIYRTRILRQIKLRNYIGSDQAFMGAIVIAGKSMQHRDILFYYRTNGDSEGVEKYIKALGLKNNRLNVHLFFFKFLYLIIKSPFDVKEISLANKLRLFFFGFKTLWQRRTFRKTLKNRTKRYLKSLITDVVKGIKV